MGQIMILSQKNLPKINLGRASGGPSHFLGLKEVKCRFETKIFLPKINLGRASGGPLSFLDFNHQIQLFEFGIFWSLTYLPRRVNSE